MSSYPASSRMKLYRVETPLVFGLAVYVIDLTENVLCKT